MYSILRRERGRKERKEGGGKRGKKGANKKEMFKRLPKKEF